MMKPLQPGVYTVSELETAGVLLVQDGNHGEYRPRSNEFLEGGIAFIRAADMDRGRVLFEKAEGINDTAYKRITKGIGKPGDILLSHKGTVGKLARAGLDAPAFVCSPQTTFWRVLDPTVLDPAYLYCFMDGREFRDQLDSRKGETDMADYVSLTAQRQLRVRIPEMAKQKQIAEILGTIDDKIELNRKTNDSLETFARTIFKSWFIDFDPVRAKAEGRKPFGMSDATAAHFPDCLVSSEVGEIPKGWTSTNLDSATEVIIDHRGKTPLKLGSDWADSGHPAVSAKNIKANRLVNMEQRYVDEALYKRWMRTPLASGDILMTSEAPMGEMYFVTVETSYVLSQRVYGIRAKSSVATAEYLYFWLDSPAARFDMEGRATGTTVVGIRQSELRMVRVLIAPKVLQDIFSELTGPMLQQVAQNERESETLIRMRDALLPRLLADEMAVREAS